ncbi:MAG: outer membrane lipoprotein-sorting protein [Candidatus Acidiferrales bacterium]
MNVVVPIASLRFQNSRLLPSRVACFSRPRQITSLFMRWQKGSAAICVALIWLGLGQVSKGVDDQRAREIVDGVARLFTSQSTIATVEMQVTKEDLQRNITMQFWSVGESNILIRIRSPQEDAGTAILKVNGKIWYYLPKANRTVKIPPSMMMSPWMGSDFTLNDLVKQSRLTDDYAIATSFEGQRDGVAISEYTLTPKPAAVVVWGKITLEVRQADRMPVRQRYYDEDGKLVRELTFSEYKTVSGRLIPTRLVMKPAGQAVEQTTITYEKIKFDEPISKATFSRKNLKQ